MEVIRNMLSLELRCICMGEIHKEREREREKRKGAKEQTLIFTRTHTLTHTDTHTWRHMHTRKHTHTREHLHVIPDLLVRTKKIASQIGLPYHKYADVTQPKSGFIPKLDIHCSQHSASYIDSQSIVNYVIWQFYLSHSKWPYTKLRTSVWNRRLIYDFNYFYD